MPLNASMETTLPEIDAPKPPLSVRGVVGEDIPVTIARLESLKHKVGAGKAKELHKEIAPITSELIDSAGKKVASAELVGKTSADVNDWKTGKEGMPLYAFLLMLRESPEMYLKLCSIFGPLHSFDPPQKRETELKPNQLFGLMVRWFQENPGAMRWLTEVAYERYGATPEAVTRQVRELERVK